MTKLHKHFHALPLRWVIGSGLVLGGLVIAGGVVSAIAFFTQQTAIVRGAVVAGRNIGGQDTLTALHNLQPSLDAFVSQAFTFRVNGKDYIVNSAEDVSQPDELVLGIAKFSLSESVNHAYDYGHRGSWIKQLAQRLSGFLGRRHDFSTYALNEPLLKDQLHKQLDGVDRPATNPGVEMNSAGKVSVTPGQPGVSVDYTTTIRTAVDHLSRLDPATIDVHVTNVDPAITTTPAITTIAQQQAPALLGKAPLKLHAIDTTWTLSKTQLASLLGFVSVNDQVKLDIDHDKVADYLADKKKSVDVAAENSRFSITNGQVEAFATGQAGHAIDVEASIQKIAAALQRETPGTVELAVVDTQPTSTGIAQNALGITELVAEATTNFHNSPTNRRFNLTYGAKLLNGLVIQPGETFSLVKALGKIDQEHGWKSELVIKGPKITPEFGGGLCQVATTMFRTALNAGVPIVERHNHSLRISYYEPPIGLDATIYEPKPDLQFTNDYSGPLLLQTEVVGNNITFRLYGKKDGRSIDVPTPKVYNRVAIPPTQYVEVETLPKDGKNCQKPGHPGADATATYTVTKADGTKVTQTFQSHYRAMPVICMVKKKAAPKPVPTTNSNINAPVADTNAPLVNTNTAVPAADANTNTTPIANVNGE